MLRKYFIPYTTKVIKSVLILTCVRMWVFLLRENEVHIYFWGVVLAICYKPIVSAEVKG